MVSSSAAKDHPFETEIGKFTLANKPPGSIGYAIACSKADYDEFAKSMNLKMAFVPLVNQDILHLMFMGMAVVPTHTDALGPVYKTVEEIIEWRESA